MDDDSFGTPPGADREINTPANRFHFRLFLNETGLRAGWRLLIYAAIFFVFWSTSIYLLGQFLRPIRGIFSPSFQFCGELVSFICGIFGSLDHVAARGAACGHVRTACGRRIRETVLAGCLFGFSEIFLSDWDYWRFRGLFLWESIGTRDRNREMGVVLGRFFRRGRTVRRVFFSRICTPYFVQGIGFWPAAIVLSVSFGAVHLQNSGEGWIGVASVAFVGLFWSFTAETNGKSVVRARDACGFRFWGDVSLFRSGQRDDFSGPSFERDLARAEVADGRLAWTGSKHFRFSDSCYFFLRRSPIVSRKERADKKLRRELKSSVHEVRSIYEADTAFFRMWQNFA